MSSHLFNGKSTSIGAHTKNYVLIASLLLLSWLLSSATSGIVEDGFAHAGSNAFILATFFEIVVISLFGFLAYELAKPTVIPSFVLAIFVGMIQHKILYPLVGNTSVLTVLTTLGAAFILFGGGLDTPFSRFRKLVGPILSLAFFGTLLTALLFSFALSFVTDIFGISVSISVLVLLGAALASTDPAAIIPSLTSLVFKSPRVKDIAISESAINDVIGAVLTGVFLSLLTIHQIVPSSIGEMYGYLFTAETGNEVLKELTIGCIVGFFGFLVLLLWSNWKARLTGGGEADAALFLAVPLLCYILASSLHGSGFLAVFIAGLLFQLEEHVSHVEHYFVHTIEGFMKPLIFMLLGASVDIHDLMSVAGLGIVMGLLFMFVIRPMVIFITLGPFMRGKHTLRLQELLFLSFVRETGVIPAVLLMGLRLSAIPGTEMVVLVGLWVILLTLILQPPLTPLVAQLLGIAHPAPAFPQRKARGPLAVLCSRGRSYIDRMASVVDWVDVHGLRNITLLHCPEEKYSEHYMAEMEGEAQQVFAAINEKRGEKQPLRFEFLGRPGSLQENIEELISNDNVSIIFVGSKMLDYRMEDVKRLRVPFVFVP